MAKCKIGVFNPPGYEVASFPGPAQLSIACSAEKRGEPGIFSHMSMTENGKNFQNKQAAFCVLFN